MEPQELKQLLKLLSKYQLYEASPEMEPTIIQLSDDIQSIIDAIHPKNCRCPDCCSIS